MGQFQGTYIKTEYSEIIKAYDFLLCRAVMTVKEAMQWVIHDLKSVILPKIEIFATNISVNCEANKNSLKQVNWCLLCLPIHFL